MSAFLVSALHRSKAAGEQRIAVVVEHEAVGERLRHSNYRPPHMNKKCGDDIARKVETTVAKRIGSRPRSTTRRSGSGEFTGTAERVWQCDRSVEVRARAQTELREPRVVIE